MAVASLLQGLGNSREISVFKEPGQLAEPDFDAGEVGDEGRVTRAEGRISSRCRALDTRYAEFMMPYPHVVKAEVAKEVLCLLDHSQLFFGDRFAVRDAN